MASATSSSLKHTPLHDRHIALGARMMAFGGYDMPVQYSSIIDEHKAVREAAGLFDVSHMGEVRVTGPEAFAFVQHLVTNDAAKLTDGRAMYTVMCLPDGGIVDDLIVYRVAEDEYLLVINAANRESDIAWMREHNPMGAVLTDESEETALLALQGPTAFDILEAVAGESVGGQRIRDIKFYHFLPVPEGAFVGCKRAILSHTGYTGERGFEIYCEAGKAADVWDALMDAGEAHGLTPAGLGARDTLRLEAGYCLYGQDITRATNPLEAGLGWVVKLDAEGDFLGRDALRHIKEEGPARKLVAFVMDERGIPRHDYPILDADTEEEIGVVTSGTQSPILEQGIGLGYVPNEPAYTEPGRPLAIGTRRRALSATVHKPPLHKS